MKTKNNWLPYAMAGYASGWNLAVELTEDMIGKPYCELECEAKESRSADHISGFGATAAHCPA
ncbi:MAG: hypothetical protein P4M01_07485 [Acidobacteriota bacterium]|nr:hypothetical protein [Acidobacteriota bacterium]